MSSANLGMIIEILVAMLLVTTICYCVVLNSRLKSLRADEHILKATIGELLAATEIAERAIIGLKATTREAEQALGQKLRDAQTMRNDLQHMTSTQVRVPQPAQIPEQRIAAPLPAPVQQPVRMAPPPPPAEPVLSTPAPQQVAAALRGLDQALNTPRPSEAAPAQDFRVFTRPTFSNRG
ncbi:MAG: DUF6468 domain-containing protein [Pseudomonadota bacterium]